MKRRISLSLLLTLFALSSCAGGEGKASSVYDGPIHFDSLYKDVELHSELQNAYLNDDLESILDYADGKKELSYPLPAHLEWESEEEEEEYRVILSEYKDLANPKVYEAKGNEVDIYNLKVDSTYFYAVSRDGKTPISEIASFHTSVLGPRNLYIPGMTNCRDVGGLTTKDGGSVKQGNVFRTGNADNITEEGIKAFFDLGIATEIDIRDTGSISSSPLGEEVSYYSYKMYYDDYSNYIERNCESIAKAFRVFAKEESYPLFYHCRIGTDRTGYMTYLFLGLLGCEEEDIQRDYLFSNFGVIESARTLHGSGVNDVQLYYDAINAFPGKTLQERIYNFLISIGLSEEELDFIIDFNTVPLTEKKVLDGNRPLAANANEFTLSAGLSLSDYNGLPYVRLSQKKDESVSFVTEIKKSGNYDCYVYMYTSFLTLSPSESFSLLFDATKMELTDATFRDLHYRSTSGIYVAAKFASVELKEGDVEVTLTNISSSKNTNANGGDVARIILIPNM